MYCPRQLVYARLSVSAPLFTGYLPLRRGGVDGKNGLILLFPSSPTFLAYRKIFGVGSYVLKALWMSLLRTVVGTLTSVSINALVGYALSRGKFPRKG